MPNSYDSAWSRWPITYGEIWQVGPHVIACGDHEDQAFEKLELVFSDVPAMTYVDPPWTPSLASGYRTKAGVPHKVNFPMLLYRVLNAASWASGPIWVESGTQHERAMIEAGERVGMERVASWDATYYNTRPSRVHLFKHPGALLDFEIPNLTGFDDEDIPAVVIQAASRPGDLIFDPCTGQGLTAETSAMMGRRFIGIELHPGRMARAIDRLANATGEQPIRWGSL